MSAPRTASAVLAQARTVRPGQPQRFEIELELRRRLRIGVEQPQFPDAEHVMECDRLEFALRAVADERHHPASPARHVAAASADIAAVRSAVTKVISDSNNG